jgi:hypothetical protein
MRSASSSLGRFAALLAIVAIAGACVTSASGGGGPSSDGSVPVAGIPSPGASTTIVGPDPTACTSFGFSARRCAAVVRAARDQLPAGHPTIVGVDLLPDDQPGVVRTTTFVANVRFRFEGGGQDVRGIFCGVGPPSLVCSEDPGLEAVDFHQAGYWDVPCTGEAPSGCATPLAPDPGLAGTVPLSIPVLDLPVGGVGHHEVDVGQAIVPNGIVSDASFKLANQAQRGFLIDPGIVRLELRSTIPGRPPFDNVYRRGRFDGTEAIRVLLVYDVAEASPGADPLEVRDLVVC